MPAEPVDIPAGDRDEVLSRVYREGLRRRRRRYLFTGASSSVGLVALALVITLAVEGDPSRTVTANALSSTADPTPPASGSTPSGASPAEPEASPGSRPAADPPSTAAGPASGSGSKPTSTTAVTASPSTTAVPTTTPATGSDTSQPAGTTATSTTTPLSSAVTDPGGALRVSPTAGALDLQPQRFDSAVVSDGGRSVVLRFWAGIAPCSVLGRVDVEQSGAEVKITLWTGRAASTEPGTACIAIAQYYETVIELAGPLDGRPIVDGAA